MKLNVPRILKLADVIEASETFYMPLTLWRAGHPQCGAPACAAGHLAHMLGMKVPKSRDEDSVWWIALLATRLGLDNEQAADLFYGEFTGASIVEITAKETADHLRELARVAS